MLQRNKCRIHSKLIMFGFLRGKENDVWMCPPSWKLNFTYPSIKIDYKSPPQSTQAALRISESVPTTKMLKKVVIN